MKKIIFGIIIFFSFYGSVNAEKIEVTLNKCVDGDTAWFNLNNEIIKVRFLAIDTPESTNKIEPYGKEASAYTCTMLKGANKIELEYDEFANKDKYNRTLAWVFVDDNLLQDLIIKKGLANVAYLYDDYKYTSTLQISEQIAKEKQIGIWNNNSYYIFFIIIVFILLIIFNKKFRNKIIKKIIKSLNKKNPRKRAL